MKILKQCAGWLLLYALSAGVAHAAAVRQLSFSSMVDYAELIFEGRVVGHRSEWEPSGKLIVTHVDFEVSDVLKGGPYGRVRLTYVGGSVDGKRLDVPGVRPPEKGESGIYFVESMQRLQVSPILGVNQGQFRIFDGRLHTSGGRPVVGFNDGPGLADKTLSPQFPSGLRVGEQRSASAITVGEFKLHVDQLLREQRKEVAQ